MIKTDLLPPLTCINIGVLFNIIQVMRVWYGIMINLAALTNDSRMLNCLLAAFQGMEAQTGGWGTVCESMERVNKVAIIFD